jgi:lysozyme
MALAGIDVSEYQGEIDWQTVADSGVSFCFVKCTEGAQSSDPMFATNWAAMKSVGIIRSAYHFFVASKDPVVQANNFLRLTQKVWEDSDLPPVLDLEKTYFLNPSSIIDRAQIWLNTVERALGRKPILYTFPNFWHEGLGDIQRLSNYPLWIAHYETDNPWVPGGWKDWVFHQYSESGSTPGIEGDCDLNRFKGNLDDLQKLIKGPVPLRLGSRGQVVAKLQQLLNKQGANIGVADGAFGPRTKNAVINFQKSRQLLPDGIVGPRTWLALEAKPTTTPPTQPPNQPPATALSLTNVCRSYRGLTHQEQALQWLQGQIPSSQLAAFTTRWRQDPDGPSRPMSTAALSLTNVCKSYRSLPHQEDALQALQSQLSPAILAEFTKRWRQG